MKRILFLTCFLILFIPGLVKADGAIFMLPDSYYTESQQQAIIFHHDNQETLILSTAFKGDLQEFAWVIPTPAKPELKEASENFFNVLADYTKPRDVDYTPPGWFGIGALDTAGEIGVTIIETKEVGDYIATTLSATDPDSLVNWLNENGFQYEDRALPIFQEYIDDEWYFVALKIKPEIVEKNEEFSSPIRLDFESSEIIYPLKMTTAGEITSKEIPILLYIFADHKQTLPDVKSYKGSEGFFAYFPYEFADNISQKKLKNLLEDSQEDVSLASQDFYLTKMFFSAFPVEKMDQDLVFEQAKDDEGVNAHQSTSSVVLTTALMWVLSAVFTGFYFLPFLIIFTCPLWIVFLVARSKYRSTKSSAKAKRNWLITEVIIITLYAASAVLLALVYMVPFVPYPLLVAVFLFILMRKQDQPQTKTKKESKPDTNKKT